MGHNTYENYGEYVRYSVEKGGFYDIGVQVDSVLGDSEHTPKLRKGTETPIISLDRFLSVYCKQYGEGADTPVDLALANVCVYAVLRAEEKGYEVTCAGDLSTIIGKLVKKSEDNLVRAGNVINPDWSSSFCSKFSKPRKTGTGRY